MGAKNARIINIIAGIWLFISAFAWPHSQAQFTNTWIVGLLITIVAMIGLREPSIRYVNTVLAIWLFISAWALETASVGTTWNNVIVAIIVFFASLVGSNVRGRFTTPRGTPRPA